MEVKIFGWKEKYFHVLPVTYTPVDQPKELLEDSLL